jgi:hypothetical protein
MRLSRLNARTSNSRVNVSASAIIARVAALLSFSVCTLGVKFFFGTKTWVGVARLNQALKRGFICVKALRLKVWACRAANLRAFIPIKAKPAHCAQNDLRVFFS